MINKIKILIFFFNFSKSILRKIWCVLLFDVSNPINKKLNEAIEVSEKIYGVLKQKNGLVVSPQYHLTGTIDSNQLNLQNLVQFMMIIWRTFQY